ncbi:hypothetical protein OPT61_g2409 [Boeremia exigua]|uniref:Uncharacterized protein n=1 Tax=Boeremia exigua TaxID=749465 RepID=A0ACC2ILV8_9PLEO|nr:hypothetical protein OPT61_g2409 [Boeremia exigua]
MDAIPDNVSLEHQKWHVIKSSTRWGNGWVRLLARRAMFNVEFGFAAICTAGQTEDHAAAFPTASPFNDAINDVALPCDGARQSKRPRAIALKWFMRKSEEVRCCGTLPRRSLPYQANTMQRSHRADPTGHRFNLVAAAVAVATGAAGAKWPWRRANVRERGRGS